MDVCTELNYNWILSYLFFTTEDGKALYLCERLQKFFVLRIESFYEHHRNMRISTSIYHAIFVSLEIIEKVSKL